MAKYKLIDTKEKLKKLDSILMDEDGENNFEFISYDTETTGLSLYKTVIIGFSISTDSKKGYYIPFLKWVPDKTTKKNRKIDKKQYHSYMDGQFQCIWTKEFYPENITPEEYKPPKLIRKYMKRWLTSTDLIMHNAPFDVNQTYINTGIDLSDNLFMDTSLLVHIINENTPNGLKKVAKEWKEELNINPHAEANKEQLELGESVRKNGGKYKGLSKEVWRADLPILCKYAVADTFLTYGVFEVGMEKFIEEFGEEMLRWLLHDEVMPLCREVVIPMKRKGVYIDVPYFETLKRETLEAIHKLEDKIINQISPLLKDFPKGKAVSEVVTHKKLVDHLFTLENLEYPKKYDKKEEKWKPTLSKQTVSKYYQKNPHWLYGYILGEDEIKYSSSKLESIKRELYRKFNSSRYRFNIGSPFHLRWLFCNKLEHDPKSLPQTDSATADNPIPKMDSEVLTDYFSSKYEWVNDLILYKKLNKLFGTYIMPAVDLNINGYLIMDMRQNGTISGRFSCSGGFNLQTLPRVEELDKCPSCNSKDIEIRKDIEILAKIYCNDCKQESTDIICPSAIKKGFIAPPGYKIVNADYSSLEPRCFAQMSGSAELKKIYLEGLDLYSKIYCDMMKEDYRNLKEAGETTERNMIKPVILGIPYGSGDSQVANLMGFKKKKVVKGDDGKSYTKEYPDSEKGRYYRRLYLDAYPDLENYMKTQEIKAITEGSVETIVGRKRHFKYAVFVNELISQYNLSADVFAELPRWRLEKEPESLGLTEEGLHAFSEHFSVPVGHIKQKGGWKYIQSLFLKDWNGSKNTPIQGLAGHITNKGMLTTARWFKKKNIDGWICLQVHDEITTYIREDQVEIGAKYLKKGMEKNKYTKLIEVPMIADPIIADNLKEAK